MKERIKAKMDEHIERVLAKTELSNDDFCLLNMVFQKIEMDELNAERKAQMEADSLKRISEMKSMMESMWGNG